MTRLLGFLVALALIGASGVVAGMWTNRWVASRSIQEAADRLAQVPLKVGDWDGTDVPLNDQAMTAADVTGYLHRRYVHRQSGAAVTVLVVCGRSGPICVHTPEICYTNAGWVQTATSAYRTAPGEEAVGGEFSVLEFRHGNAASPQQMRLYLAWGTKEGWSAPKQPRLAFIREPVLFKMYAIREVPRLSDSVEQDPAAKLIQALLPPLHATLFGS